ncbi:hypothetical protein [Pseudomonas quasicaspiana]|uniref:hypothetical protein n=1 Tax=Pseudomonas quasicaspiana TaxID=2829821 RepID=UPI001E57B1DF|nr:hypothetical protein [Pseudomonas quasicaspiana]MCD5969668.1 hypothetical protein [Pseudomonas quasicaspiana]
MEINSAVKVSNLYSVVPSKVRGVEKPITEVDTLVVGKTDSVEKFALHTAAKAPGKAEEVEHYVYEEAPWLKLKFDDPLMEMSKKSLYLIDITLESIGQTEKINSAFQEFSERLKDLRPDIASTGYGFTLDENANIEILDGRQPLCDADKLWLTDEINKFKDLRNTVHAHSKTLMALVDHTKDFGGKYNLNRHNFQSVIDYKDILNTPHHDFYERSLSMVKSYAPARTEPRINTYA